MALDFGIPVYNYFLSKNIFTGGIGGMRCRIVPELIDKEHFFLHVFVWPNPLCYEKQMETAPDTVIVKDFPPAPEPPADFAAPLSEYLNALYEEKKEEWDAHKGLQIL